MTNIKNNITEHKAVHIRQLEMWAAADASDPAVRVLMETAVSTIENGLNENEVSIKAKHREAQEPLPTYMTAMLERINGLSNKTKILGLFAIAAAGVTVGTTLLPGTGVVRIASVAIAAVSGATIAASVVWIKKAKRDAENMVTQKTDSKSNALVRSSALIERNEDMRTTLSLLRAKLNGTYKAENFFSDGLYPNRMDFMPQTQAVLIKTQPA